MRPRNVTVLAYDGVRLMDVTAPLEVFGTAARMGGAYTLTLCSPTGAPVTTSAGTRLLVDAAATEIDGTHTLVVPGSVDFPQHAPPLPLLDAVTALAATSERIASVCTGAFLLARAGLLDGRRAVTHWRHAATLARRHPGVTVEPDAIFVRDGTVYTSAGVTAGIDLALALVESDEGADLAREVARDLVVFLRRPGGQSQFSVPSRARAAADDPLRPVLDAIATDPAADHSLPVLARLGGFSPRHLTRLFHERVGSTPAVYVEAVRIEAAQSLLAAGATVTAAATHSGLGSDESLRRAFLRRLGVTPSTYRSRFRSTTQPADATSTTPGRVSAPDPRPPE
ncbi:GlxA family transcriptional regulator [Embleya sp. NPDC127516]|uniref:GlxA family transcriptional regulator n=1 Tax=Embleya sp. NPDC127516 TaxID=3363990 RepID=UPI0038304C30